MNRLLLPALTTALTSGFAHTIVVADPYETKEES